MLTALNENVVEFVRRPENHRLRAGTGVYSNHFRGSFMGETNADEVWQKISERGGIDLLWLGANPNVPESLERILSGADDAHFEIFLNQLEQGWYGDVNPAKGHAIPWDPLANVKQQGWVFYRDALQRVVDKDAIVFANILPWGSKNIELFVKGLQGFDPDLFGRVLTFADTQVRTMIELLKPRYVLIPRSFSDRREVRNAFDSPIFGGKSYPFDEHRFKPGKTAMTFRFRKDADLGATIIQGAHPSALRPRGEFRDAYIDIFSQLILQYAV